MQLPEVRNKKEVDDDRLSNFCMVILENMRKAKNI